MLAVMQTVCELWPLLQALGAEGLYGIAPPPIDACARPGASRAGDSRGRQAALRHVDGRGRAGPVLLEGRRVRVARELAPTLDIRLTTRKLQL